MYQTSSDILNAYEICNTHKKFLSIQNGQWRLLGVMCRSVVVSALTVFQIALLGDADCKDALCSFEKLSVLEVLYRKW